jgi:hypothetical protein
LLRCSISGLAALGYEESMTGAGLKRTTAGHLRDLEAAFAFGIGSLESLLIHPASISDFQRFLAEMIRYHRISWSRLG